MKKINILIGIILILSIFVNGVSAVTVLSNSPKTDTEPGEIFELRIEVKSDATGNYTVTIDPGTKFSCIDDNTTITKEIPLDETRTFVFNMKIEEELEDGKHIINYDVSFEGELLNSYKAYVRAGKQAPGFEVILAFLAIASIVILFKKIKK